MSLVPIFLARLQLGTLLQRSSASSWHPSCYKVEEFNVAHHFTRCRPKDEYRLMNSHLEQLQQALAASIADISEEEWKWHPPEKWCAGEVLEHLYLTYTGTLKGFERVLQAGKPLATLPTLAQRLRVLVAVDF